MTTMMMTSWCRIMLAEAWFRRTSWLRRSQRRVGHQWVRFSCHWCAIVTFKNDGRTMDEAFMELAGYVHALSEDVRGCLSHNPIWNPTFFIQSAALLFVAVYVFYTVVVHVVYSFAEVPVCALDFFLPALCHSRLLYDPPFVIELWIWPTFRPHLVSLPRHRAAEAAATSAPISSNKQWLVLWVAPPRTAPTTRLQRAKQHLSFHR